MIIDNEYEIGDSVYLKTDTEQKRRMVTGLFILPNTLQYRLSCESTESYHYSIEISSEKSYLSDDILEKVT
jgi:hypothetical protein